MTPVAVALALFMQAQPAADPASGAAPQAAAQDRFPPGAPRDDYQFVAWCYGAVRAYIDLHDTVMPEVTRIESTYRAPGRKLSDDLKVYADLQKASHSQLKLYQSALTAAEKASVRPINVIGAAAVQKGRAVWTAGPDITKARLAQEWMSWAPPAKCETTAKDLETRSNLLGVSLKANVEPEGAPPPAGDQPAAEPK
ncbi:MAG TPA: hypothetical protein VFW13_07785 [Phenylobacterium sp.]|nr:hypothetical protein [Phenylobacterium sp.]